MVHSRYHLKFRNYDRYVPLVIYYSLFEFRFHRKSVIKLSNCLPNDTPQETILIEDLEKCGMVFLESPESSFPTYMYICRIPFMTMYIVLKSMIECTRPIPAYLQSLKIYFSSEESEYASLHVSCGQYLIGRMVILMMGGILLICRTCLANQTASLLLL